LYSNITGFVARKIHNELFLILFAADVFLFFAVIVLGNKNRVNKKVKTRKGEIVSEFMLESVVETVIYLVQILLERII